MWASPSRSDEHGRSILFGHSVVRSGISAGQPPLRSLKIGVSLSADIGRIQWPGTTGSQRLCAERTKAGYRVNRRRGGLCSVRAQEPTRRCCNSVARVRCYQISSWKAKVGAGSRISFRALRYSA
jgi:hypothetical protein